ncbi:class I SAM-dependent methyltransferase [Luedemannella helvata]|uniref:Class I SAM-dependent methyltransferase n=1 Tax=Luedemannella helvata TaxID=349315 RepID=A0ABN2JQF3_9ACTN
MTQPTDAAARFAALLAPEGADALAAAGALWADSPPDPLAAAAAMRAAGIPADLASTALTQAGLRHRAGAKFGPDAARLFFTRAGLEQATRAAVATRRAERLAAAGVRHVADLGCGIGADTIAFARAGLRVRAVDADPLTAAVAAANVAALGLSDQVTVTCADATAVPLDTVDGVFCDPARRRAGGGRVFDPRAYSPPWDFVTGLAERVPATVLKLGPGIDHALIPAHAEAEWVSVAGEVVEAALWCGPLAQAPRKATLLSTRDRAVNQLVGSGDALAPVGPVGRFVHDPDGAVVRAHLVAEFAATIGARLADPTIAYCYTDGAAPSPYASGFEVLETLPFSLKRLRAAVRAHGLGILEIRKRGSALEPERLRRDLRLSGGGAGTLLLTRVAGAPTAIIARAVPVA